MKQTFMLNFHVICTSHDLFIAIVDPAFILMILQFKYIVRFSRSIYDHTYVVI